jgi:hypothetical protein
MKNRRHRAQFRGGFVMLLLLVTFSARGGEPAPKERRNAALGMCREKNPSGARQLREDYEKTGQPEILFDLGECHEQLGRDDQALKSYRDYLRLPLALRVAEANARIQRIEARQQAAAQAVQPPRYVLLPSTQEAGACRRSCTSTETCRQPTSRGQSNYPGWAMAQNRCLTKEFSCLSACPGAVVKPGKCPAAATKPGYDCLEDRTPRTLPGLLTPGKF